MVNKSSVLSKQLLNIQMEASNLYYSILNNKEVNFIKDVLKNDMSFEDSIIEIQEIDNLEALPMIELRDSESGEEFTVYVLRITNNTLDVLSSLDNTVLNVMYSQISTITDQLILINEIENYLKKQSEDLYTWSFNQFGDVKLRNVMIDVDGTNLVEGIEYIFEDENIENYQIVGYIDLDELLADDVEKLIEETIS